VRHCPAGGEACCLNLLFPYLRELHVEKVEDQADAVLITARCRSREAACHRCGLPSARVNSRCRRRLHDLAVGGRAVVIDLEVRRFFCGNPACQLRTFAEQVPAVAARHQHRTVLLRSLLEAIGLALAGRASLECRPGRRLPPGQSRAACLACGSSGPRVAARAVASCRAASRSTIMAM
jgi:hypothetical protein